MHSFVPCALLSKVTRDVVAASLSPGLPFALCLVLTGLDDLATVLEESEAVLNIRFVSGAHGAVNALLEGVVAHAQSAFVSKGSRNFTLHLVGLRRADDACIIDQAVLGRIFLCLKSSEESLLSAEHLDGGSRLLGQVDERAGVRNELGAHELTDELGKVGSDGGHAVLQVLSQVSAVLRDRDDLAGESLKVTFIVIGNLSTHGNLSSLTHLIGDILRYDFLQGLLSEVLDVGAHANELDGLSIDYVVGDNLGQLGEVPRVPLLQAHGIVVQLLVEVLQERDSLDDHGVDLVGGESQFIPGDRVSKTELHLLHLRALDAVNKALHLEANAAHQLVSLLARLAGNAELLLDGLAELVVGDEELVLNLFLHDVLGEELVEALGDLALHQLLNRLHGVLGVLELGESLKLDDRVGGLAISEALMELVELLKLLSLNDLEEGEAGGCLE
mmetsp:Transcript_22450/g.27657  ORF Transcript_22450/g.27657 Transcript_22450/m.27657 type:complete len:445 (-) Transcript_22450:59-1393(-)